MQLRENVYLKDLNSAFLLLLKSGMDLLAWLQVLEREGTTWEEIEFHMDLSKAIISIIVTMILK